MKLWWSYRLTAKRDTLNIKARYMVDVGVSGRGGKNLNKFPIG